MRDDVGVRECVCACGRVDALAQRPATAVSTVFVALLVTLIDGDLGLDLVFFCYTAPFDRSAFILGGRLLKSKRVFFFGVLRAVIIEKFVWSYIP